MSTPKPQVDVPHKPHKSRRRKWVRLTRLSQLAARISVIVGVLVALYGLYDARERAQFAVQTNKLQTLQYIQNFINEDFEIQRKITALDYRRLVEMEAKVEKEGGRRLYFSPKDIKDGDDALSSYIGDVSTIGEHYERMGAEIRLEYLDFNLVYEIVPFPDDFWKNTSSLRKALRENWNGPGKPLNDLWSNFAYLCDKYHKERYRRGDGDGKACVE